MVEPGIINGMLAYVSMSALALHRHLFEHQEFQRQGLWQPIEVHPPSTCSVGVMGLGVLGQCDILICLLPRTDATRGILNARLFAALPAGSALLHVGRGGHLDQQALPDALDSGHLRRAVLDVCDPEPLPADHALWRHPRVVLTPHVTSMTQPETAVPVLIDNLRRHQRGEALQDQIDRSNGY